MSDGLTILKQLDETMLYTDFGALPVSFYQFDMSYFVAVVHILDPMDDYIEGVIYRLAKQECEDQSGVPVTDAHFHVRYLS